jgi:hypothetical protein
MISLDSIKKRAQAQANRDGETLAILNLNTIGAAMYVIRTYHPSMREGRYAHQFVCVINPEIV